ncbi:MAG: 4-hydroxythreonine-4-phosphate dehydrogenase PdxA [Candidatus Omnitrophica bacterium CG_4_9_14_0_2_um_filter_42_8]|nr:MAG: 4-hydroxythreonine-4-phosphate dehydrogenase PdxA [Candidatus Omnitrophica bacterium CG22_combo_CG10-13_8_21_14_all_43_16]PJC48268.1 MAG: 4-hydroxythreonine-4-phosphate dehydrogenase PdxA [Candidatus Omnitrophica bacterium CG_4_9_14_0_2_um_filter_42_8]
MIKPTVLITTGDPRGIGPEVTKKALEDPGIKRLANFFIIEPKDKTGFDAVKKAAEILKNRKARALVTAPVNKEAINRSGIPFEGHTEYLAEASNTKKFAMMLCGGALKVTTVTRHVPLKKVSGMITQAKIIDAVKLTDFALKKYFGIKKPKIGICALNPHCGEGGKIGGEEQAIIIPAVKKIRRLVPEVQGPISGDIIFYMAIKGKLDAVISMYHDQGLGPLKMLAFEKGVNVTLGLPFIRTSPDHGTAYDIAGTGIADPSSMKEAIKLAVRMCYTNSTLSFF